jgi:uncharacterized protein
MRGVFGIVFGLAFGFWLSWTGFTSYDVITSGLLFENFYLWMLFPTAVAASAAGIWLLKISGVRTLSGAPVVWERVQPRREHVIGAALFGLGWALTGACPGPAVAQIGKGQLAGLFTTAGILVGVYIRGRIVAARQVIVTETGTCSS